MKFWKKAASVLTACTMLTCSAAAVSANAAADVEIAVDRIELTLSDLEKMNYQVPVYVRLKENPGVNAVEFGVRVDERCVYEVKRDQITDDGELLIWEMVKSTEDDLSWLTWASATLIKHTGPMVRFDVTVPEGAEVGERYTIEYLETEYKDHLWNDNINKMRYVDEGLVNYTDGYIQIISEEEKPGDTNCDGTVNVLDVIRLNKNLLSGEGLSEYGIQNADVDGDGTPSVADSLLILKYIIKLVDKL